MAEARTFYEQALSVFREAGDPWRSARSLTDLAYIDYEQSKPSHVLAIRQSTLKGQVYHLYRQRGHCVTPFAAGNGNGRLHRMNRFWIVNRVRRFKSCSMQ